MHSSSRDAQRFARALALEIPEAVHLQTIMDACTSASSSADGLNRVLETSAFLLLCPEQTVRVARAMGPLLLETVARALSAARVAPISDHAANAQGSSKTAIIIDNSAAVISPAERGEDVLVAMSRLLPLAPYALPLALQHWKCSPCPFECITMATAGCSSGGEEIVAAASVLRKRVHKVAEAAHRLLSCAAVGPSILTLWNWCPFFDLCRHPDALVRWHAVGVCSSLLGLDEQGRRGLLHAARALDVAPQERAPPENSSRINGGDDAEVIINAGLDLAEDLRQSPAALLPPAQGQDLKSLSTSSSFQHHPSIADIGGILHPRTAPSSSGGGEGGGQRSLLVHTASSRRNISSLSLALAVGKPILLHGPAGSGKSLLAREAARLISGSAVSNRGDTYESPPTLLELHLDDQTDSKSLLGTHACTDVPGEFAWRPGALTRAAAAGAWVLIEDLDRAPFEVLAAIGPLLEGRPLVLPGRRTPLKAAPGFRVLGTVTTVGVGRVVLGGAADFGALWTHVPVEPLSMSEVLQVAKARYPRLPSPAVKRLLSTMIAARGGSSGNCSSGGGGFGFAPRSSSAGREPGVRDFLKLCSRVNTLGVFDGQEDEKVVITGSGGGEDDDGDGDVDGDDQLEGKDGWFCSEAQALPVVVESIDVFAGHLTTKDALAHAAEAIAGLWNILPSKAVELATTSRPEFVQGEDYMKIGRVTLPRLTQTLGGGGASSSFAPTSHALRLMETLAASTRACEPVLLVGETGCGKTALVQRLAEGTGRELIVQNLSLQTDGADLLGGFRPVELRQLAQEVLEEFLRLFPLLFSATQNARFCHAITSSFERRQWSRLSKGLRNAAKMAMEKLDRSSFEHHSKDSSSDSRNRLQRSNKAKRAASSGGATSPSGQRRDWEQFSSNAEKFERQRVAVEGSFAFSFVEGVLVKAIREGKWVLLDEINLASAETLQRLSGLLEGAEGSLCLTERGDIDQVVRHKEFRLFAAMNPPTDASKKDLPPALRRRFSEVYVPELEDRLDLKQIVDGYISGVAVDHESLAFTAVDLYLWARGLSSESLSDGAGQRPRYSLRTLVGAVSSARRLVDLGFSPKRAMIEGYRCSFETQLDGDGRAKILKGILRAFGKGMTPKDLEKPPRRPGGRGSSNAPWVRIGPFWLEGGPLDPVDAAQLDPITNQRRFVLTASVEGTLRCLARAVASANSPVLLQGPTSAGKTSIVEYLAARLGHRCVRINNHEHTDLQEYTGSYAADGNGKLAFQEGVLVEALRKGWWIILDELNLSPSEVLEALNRLLDHNRELYLSETQETIKPHPNFRLFATQNPPGAYGGRKLLSRAFRNRFVEVHVDDIPGAEWEVILAERCGLPPSHCKLLVKVLHELQAQRQSSRLFLGKHSAISPRDLLRWAGRKPQGKQQLAEEGYMLLAERLRSEEEKAAMRLVLEDQIGVPIDPACLYGTSPPPSRERQLAEMVGPPSTKVHSGGDHRDGDHDPVNQDDLGGYSQLSAVEAMLGRGEGLEAGLQGVALTRHMRRLFRLSGRCLSHLEPLLLVGATGCGKTTVCQLYSMLLRRRMHVVNCHQHTEAADLLGGLRPLRGRDLLVQELRERAKAFVERCQYAASCHGCGDWDDFGNNASTLYNLDVSGVTAALQAAWNKVLNILHPDHGHGRACPQEAPPDVNSDKPAELLKTAQAGKPMQKRTRPSEGEDSGSGEREREGIDAVSSSSQVSQVSEDQAGGDRVGALSESSAAGAAPSKGSKCSRAKRRKSAAADPTALSFPCSGSDSKKELAITSIKASVVTAVPTTATTDTITPTFVEALETEFASLKALASRTRGMFEWVDGPLVTAMRRGEMILLDELSLAEDAVLERLNSVLEPGRSITLAEKGGEGAIGGHGAAETVVAAPGFRVMATMNPGGDFGKRELSPALRSRFTEVWVPPLSDREDMEGVVHKAFHFGKRRRSPTEGNSSIDQSLTQMAGCMLDFAWWFNNTASPSLGGGHGLSLSVRDLLSWAGFITSSLSPLSGLRPWEAYVHGAALVLLDGVGLGAGLSPLSGARLRRSCVEVLKEQIPACPEQVAAIAQLDRDSGAVSDKLVAWVFEVRETTLTAAECSEKETNLPTPTSTRGHEYEFGVPPFFTACGPLKALGPESAELDFSIRAPTTSKNLFRVLRALQVRKAVLLEGSPGVGKTSLISALAAATGHELVRINLSEQTDVSDLFGSDLPLPDSESVEQSGKDVGDRARFAWCDGVFLSALKAGKWVLLDELNLATQSVLEGLNACLDHRAEVYIPELGRSFRCPPTFKVFAAQNPLGQGGGRKGLPRSFLSRFTKVFVDPLTPDDLTYIAENKFPWLAAAAPPIAPLAAPPPSSALSDPAPAIDDGDTRCFVVGVEPPSKASLLSRMIAFNSLVQQDTMEAGRYGRQGSPWEFNLRDVFRWCEVMSREQERGAGTSSGADLSWEPWLLVDTLYIQRMRTRGDRDAVFARFREAFPEAFQESSCLGVSRSGVCVGGIGTHPVLKITPEWVQVGQTVLPRGCWTNGDEACGAGDVADGLKAGLTMPLGLRRPLQALARCVAMGWPALVVGHRGTGKTSIIRGLAAAVGARLTEVAMTPSVDVTELLGCFEQTDARSAEDSLIEELQSLSERICIRLLLVDGARSNEAARVGAGTVWNALHAVCRFYRRDMMVPGINRAPEHNALGFSAQGMGAVDHLFATLEAAVEKISTSPPLPGVESDRGTAASAPAAEATANKIAFGAFHRQLRRAAALVETVRRQKITQAPPVGGAAAGDVGYDDANANAGGSNRKLPAASCFRWSDGVLVEALERGDWVVLDGANLCSASVLDRLNPLLEPGGVLPLTECGTSPTEGNDNAGGEGSVSSPPQSSSNHRIIRPHPNFRLFLTADPSCGEVSRAMRNRCVEVALLDAPPAVAVVSGRHAMAVEASRRVSCPTMSVTEHAADLLSLVRVAGLSHPAEAMAAVAVHSALVARRLRGKCKMESTGEGPAGRMLFLWAELVAASRARSCLVEDGERRQVLKQCMSLAYPGLTPAEISLAESVLSACLTRPCSELGSAATAAELLESLVPCGWREFVKDSAASQVLHDVKLLRIVCTATSTAGLSEADRCLLSLVVDPTGDEGSILPASLVLADTQMEGEAEDAALVHLAEEAGSSLRVSHKLLAHAAGLFARKASSGDRRLRAISAARLAASALHVLPPFERGALAVDVGKAVPAMMAALFDSSAWDDVAAMVSETALSAYSDGVGRDTKMASLGQAAALAGSRWSAADPRTNPDLYRSFQRQSLNSPKRAPCVLLLNLINESVGRRLPLILAERAELAEARSRLSCGRGGEAGLGWLGLSCLMCEGDRDSWKVGGRSGTGCSDTRLARTALAPYLLPLLEAVDGLVDGLVCKQAVELATAGDSGYKEFGDSLLAAVRTVLESRDTVSTLLSLPVPSKTDEPGADASAGGMLGGRREELLFSWDPFLVSWRWLRQALEALRVVIFDSPCGLDHLAIVSSGFATLEAIGIRVDAAVLQHAGGAAPTRDTLWKRGPRAAAPSSAAGAMALARLGRLADGFRVLPLSSLTSFTGTSADSNVVSLGILMRQAHPSLCVPLDTRQELLHALCTLHWAISGEQIEDSFGNKHSVPTATAKSDGDEASAPNRGASLAESLPSMLETSLNDARARFQAKHKGTRLGAVGRRDDGLEHHLDDLEPGEKFDDFDTEAAEAVANATLLVVSGDVVGPGGGGDSAAGGGGAGYQACGGGVLQDWAGLQLSPLMEHWIAVEECQILATLAALDVSAAFVRQNLSANNVAALMARVARLRSAMLATRSLSPAAARPHQTLLWAWDNSPSWPDVFGPLLKRLLPVALESFCRRLWENVVGTPGALSLQLGPPEMVAHSTIDGGGQRATYTIDGGGQRATYSSGASGDFAASTGPVQLLTLARSSFLLRLLSTATFRGGSVPCGVGAERDCVPMDLTLMNASARVGQFKAAMRSVRDLAYGGGRRNSAGALESLVLLSWATLCRTLRAFDGLGIAVDESITFADALDAPSSVAAAAAVGDHMVSLTPCAVSWDAIHGPLRRAIEFCKDERLAAQADSLVVPAVRYLSLAMEALVGPGAEGPSRRVEASVGLGMVLLGCLKMVLVLPSSPVDPGLRPALKKELLCKRLESVKGELTVKRWSLRLEGGGEVSPEMISLLQQARGLRDDCIRLGHEAIERPKDRPAFHAFFRDVHAFARGVGSPTRVTGLARSLSRFTAGVIGADDVVAEAAEGEGEGKAKGKIVDRAGLLQEETVWQEAAGAFVGRCRAEYGEAYVDVVTGVCDAVEMTRLGLRLLAASCSSASRDGAADGASHVIPGSVSVEPLVKAQGMLLSFPFPCCEGLTAVNDSGDALHSALGPEGLDGIGIGVDGGGGGGNGGVASGAQHVMLLKAVLSRAELLLSSGCSSQPALDAAVSAMECAVSAWSRVEAKEAEKRRKDAEIIKYKMQEHFVESEEAVNLAKLRALFPDYHNDFKDLVVDTSKTKDNSNDIDQDDNDGARAGDEPLNARVKALGHMSDKQLSSVVARHCRIFLSLAARRRRALRSHVASCSRPSSSFSPVSSGFEGKVGVAAGGSELFCSDAERLVALGDSYRASVLLADPTSRLSSCVVLGPPSTTTSTNGDVGSMPSVLHMEDAFAASHLLALADAARLCQSGRSLLEDAVGGAACEAAVASSKKEVVERRKDRAITLGGMSREGWLGEGAVKRNLLHVDPYLNFHLDANVSETRLADAPLAAVLRRVAGLLEEFPGHGVLIQLARVADRVRRMPLHSPLAAVLAGVELTLRKAQDWEQHAHRGVSLKDELRSLSSLVVRWRAIELKSWPQLLDAREGAFVLKSNRWWLHLYRLLTGIWSEDLQANARELKPDLKAAAGGSIDDPAAVHQVTPVTGHICLTPDWPSARGFFPDWLWSGLVSSEGSRIKGDAGVGGYGGEAAPSGLDVASLEHARGLFQPLDDFLRTSSIGEFFARLQMLRAFAAHLMCTSGHPSERGAGTRTSTGTLALATVVQGLWQYYSQFSEEVVSARSAVRNSIEKKLKEEAKLAKWDEQTYYSLAESSEKSHRKLSKLVSQYDEVLEVSFSEVLHRALIAGIGERQEGNNNTPNPTAPCTEIPSLGSMFSVVKKVDTPADFVDDSDDHEDNDERDSVDGVGKSMQGIDADGPDDPGRETPRAPTKPVKKKRLAFKSTPAPGNSLEILDACLPQEPRDLFVTRSDSGVSLASTDASGKTTCVLADLSPWLRQALFATGGDKAFEAVDGSAASGRLPLTARLGPLAQRMRSLLRRGVYAGRRSPCAGKMGGKDAGWWANGRPAGFVGAGLAEELCLAVFGRIQALRAKGVGKQVKKRAVLDLLGGMRKQGLLSGKSSTPPQASDMLQVMALSQPFSEDCLAGLDLAWLFSGDGGNRGGKGGGGNAADLFKRAERYYYRGLSELARLRLEAGAPVSRDITRREAEVMHGLAEHLGLLVLQQRAAATALESDLLGLVYEMRALQSLTADYGGSAACAGAAAGQQGHFQRSLPPQSPLRLALETQRQGLLRGVEAVREVQLLLKAVAASDPPASPSSSGCRAKRAGGGEGWGEAATDAVTSAEVKAAVDALETSLVEMLRSVQRYPRPTTPAGAEVVEVIGQNASLAATPLLAAEAARVVVETREAVRACSVEARGIAARFAGVLPRAVLIRVANHLLDVDARVRCALDESAQMRLWLLKDAAAAPAAVVNEDNASGMGVEVDRDSSVRQRHAAAEHASKVGERLTDAVKAMLLSVQALCPRAASSSTSAPSPVSVRERVDAQEDTEGEEEEDAWSTGATLFEAHVSAFEQARGLKLWRCAMAMASARLAIKELSEDGSVCGAPAGEAAGALVSVCGEVLVLAEQVLSAGKAVLVGMVALNKGTAKLHYVTVRVFRTLLSKGLCSDETEDGEGDGDVDGMKFDDDVEGTGMGEGEGKKDVTDQIEDEEQLLGLKGDEPDKDQAQEAKEVGEDERDKGMEMENDFEGEMFDVPKGDQQEDDKEEDGDDKEELDREMGDLGDDADIVDEKLWNEDDEDEEEEGGKDQGEEKFEAGSRLDGEKPEEDEIRTKEDGQDQDKGDQGDDKETKDTVEPHVEVEENQDGDGDADGGGEKEGEDGEEGEGEGEGPVNDDLEENYEDKPVGVEVRGEDEAMEIDEEGRDVEGDGDGDDEKGNGDDNDKEQDEDMPDDMNLDNAQEDDDGDGKDLECGSDNDNVDGDGDGDDEKDEEAQDKEGFESLAPDEDGEDHHEHEQDLLEDEQQPQGSGHVGPADVDLMEEENAKDEGQDDGDDENKQNDGDGDDDDDEDGDAMEEDQRRAPGEEEEPPAFGVEGDGGDRSVLEAAQEQGEGNAGEDDTREDGEQEKEEEDQVGQDGGGSAPDGRDDGGATSGGQGEEGGGGQWLPDMSGGEGKGDGQGNDKRRRPDAPNPFRDPGDAMRHWHRRLDMLKDKDSESSARDGERKDDEEGGDGDDGGEGKFEYVTSNEKGSSQVLGGVSEDQAAEAAHEQAEKAEAEGDSDGKDVVQDGDGDVDDGVEAMDEDDEQELPRAGLDANSNTEELHQDGVEVVDSSRKSGKQRDKDGHRLDAEDGADLLEQDEAEQDTPLAEKASLDLNSLEEPPPGGGDDNNGKIVTNPVAALDNQEDGDSSRPLPLRGQEIRLRDELHALAEELQRLKRDRDSEEDGQGLEASRELWGRLRSVTGALSQRLCEQLRLVLEPMVATKLQGDYRSGKRINMRRVIPYIASGFRKDKIWLRRTKPAKRDYQILMAIDDSESMADCGAGALALAAMTTVASGLTQLEAGQLAVARFGEDLDLLHGFGDPFTEEAGAKIVDGFTFDQQRTNTAYTLEGVVSLLEEARSGFSMSSGGIGTKGTPRQLVLLLSDGRFDRENKDRLRKLVREMNERGQLLVLIVLDKEGDTSILKTREAAYVNGKLVLNSYLDKYPFPLYILLNHIEALPETLADALRQWFELLQRQTAN